jgi:acyl carrier protein
VPSSAAVHEQLTPIIVQVVGCEPQDVVASARLGKDLGVDSLSIVEIVEALGLTFDVYIPDHTVNNLVTVQDAVHAVVHHDPHAKAPGGRPGAAVAAAPAPRRDARPLPADEIERRKHNALKFAGWFAVVGIALGGVLGFGGVALIHATGISEVSMPATPKPSSAVTTKKPTPKPTVTQSPTVEEKPKPTLDAASTEISPGEKLRLSGRFPELDNGAVLQVQVRDKGEEWDDFPVTVKTGDGGEYSTLIYTTRTGERQIRMLHKDSDTATPSVTITIG